MADQEPSSSAALAVNNFPDRCSRSTSISAPFVSCIAQCGDGASAELEPFKKFCSRRYVAARSVATGFELGQYVVNTGAALEARSHQPSARPNQRLYNFLKCSSRLVPLGQLQPQVIIFHSLRPRLRIRGERHHIRAGHEQGCIERQITLELNRPHPIPVHCPGRRKEACCADRMAIHRHIDLRISGAAKRLSQCRFPRIYLRHVKRDPPSRSISLPGNRDRFSFHIDTLIRRRRQPYPCAARTRARLLRIGDH